MGSTNFLAFNSSQANQETDAQYLIDATRTGGAGVDAIWPSPSANKTLYQAAGGVYALMQMMANKGFTTNDTNLATLTAVLANILTTADVPGNLQVLPWASSWTLNAAVYQGFQIALQGTTTLTFTGQTAGELIALLFVQDGAGGRAVVYPSNVVGGAQPDPTPAVTSVQVFKVDSTLTLRAVTPMTSSNGIGGFPIGAFNPNTGGFTALNATSLSLNGTAPVGQVLVGNGSTYVPRTAASALNVVRTNKTGVYSSGVTYTNSSASAVFEEVTMVGPNNDNTGRNYQVSAIIDSAQGPVNGITNTSIGEASIGFWVPAGSTFSATVSQTAGGTVYPPASIFVWTEVSF